MSDLKETIERETGGVKTPILTLNPEEKKYDMSFMEPAFGKMDVTDSGAETVVAAGSVDESMLSPEEQKQVEEFVKQIDVSNVKMVNSYGANAQKGISTFSSSITGTVKTKDFGDVGDSLRELRTAINSTITPEKKGLLSIFQKGKQKATYVIANYESAETNIKKIEKDLQKHQQVLTKDI
jgi:uncharacterized protein YaaN involved in tellurite resistance